MLRPVRLQRLPAEAADNATASGAESRDTVEETTDHTQTRPGGPLRTISRTLSPHTSTAQVVPAGEEGAHHLLKRTPTNYIINQLYGLWVYLSLFLLTILLTRTVSVNEYAIYGDAAAAFNTIAYIVAFGLEDATTTFVPRVVSEHGQAAAALLIRRLLLLRLLVLGLTLSALLFSLPALAGLFASIPTPLTGSIATGLRDPNLRTHIAPIAFWVLGNGIFSLLNAVYAAIMRMKVVFLVGGLGQCVLLGAGVLTLRLGWGITSILWLQGLVTFAGALAFALGLAPLLFARGALYRQPLGPVFRLGFSAWFTNLVSGALLKQIALLLLIAYATQSAQAYFNASFQLTDGANLLLVSGFGGVGVAALAAAFVGSNTGRLARTWQTLIKVETLLSAPGLIFCLFNAENLIVAIYGPAYAPAGPLFAIFLALNLLVRVLGMTVHQSTLYVLGKPRAVVLAQWVGLCVVLGLGFLLVPAWGAAGALIADGVSRLVTYGLMLAFLRRYLPEKYPSAYTLRVALATGGAALPALLFHPTSKPLLLVSGGLFVLLSALLLLLIRPLSARDLEMLDDVRPGAARYLQWFARPGA